MKEDENKVSESKPVDKICSEGFCYGEISNFGRKIAQKEAKDQINLCKPKNFLIKKERNHQPKGLCDGHDARAAEIFMHGRIKRTTCEQTKFTSFDDLLELSQTSVPFVAQKRPDIPPVRPPKT